MSRNDGDEKTPLPLTTSALTVRVKRRLAAS
jgi:hypothetical protein